MTRLSCVLAIALAACGGGTEAADLGVGAQCTSNDDCNEDIGATCILNFKGGYCGKTNCTADIDCPEASACVTHDDGVNYCFRICIDKPECNANRDLENEANCSGSVDFVDPARTDKACIPPSGA